MAVDKIKLSHERRMEEVKCGLAEQLHFSFFMLK